TMKRATKVAVLVTAAAAVAMTLASAPAGASRAGGMPMPMPMMPLGTAKWQGMKIEAIRMSPVTFGVFTGTKMRLVKKTKKDSFHLMVRLTDVHTKAPIPYASVWATIRKGKKVVFDERQWPMLSAFMGVHYGNNVALPGPGLYTLSILIGPPQVARHPEYMHVWLKPHRVTFAFKWQPKK
ncbi:MAG: iron transporter, partial [Gaiellaceae bacterium]